MNSFKKKTNRLSSRKSSALTLTGNITIDTALERHSHVEEGAQAVSSQISLFMQKVRELSDTSGTLTQAMKNYYSGSGAEDKLRVFDRAHEEVDRTIPNTLLGVAKDHIMSKLDAYTKSLDNVRQEIKVFHERQKTFDHYLKKVEKLNEEKSRRATEGKLEKPKQIEKMTRNVKKLNDARGARDEMVSSLLSQLNYFYETRISTMDPILKLLFQFQQEYYRQCATAIQVDLPTANVPV
ncbi:THO complex subunit 2 [Durusdinium trenchii]|uniref:THO complex subunit 2 n=1 Tax=Durusdinium trenchii TaxID=1381693 RepID=A0ABP0JUL4_9DINO